MCSNYEERDLVILTVDPERDRVVVLFNDLAVEELLVDQDDMHLVPEQAREHHARGHMGATDGNTRDGRQRERQAQGRRGENHTSFSGRT